METGLWAFGAAIVSFAISAVVGKFLIPFLHRLKFGQTILEEGPNWHKDKQGTPTMGGIMFIIGIVIATTAGVLLYAIGHGGLDSVSRFVFIGLLYALLNGGIGFIDDYVKVVKKRNLGLTAKQKLILQFISVALYLFLMYICKDDTRIIVPFVGYVDLGFFYYIIMAVALVGIVNSVNLTDGIDGLDGSITFFCCLFMMLIANVLGGHQANVIYAAAAAGGCLGFLIWNFHPAKCFMGDTGSLFLGGMVCSLAVAMDMQLMLLLLALTYILEELSVVLQVSYFKLTHGKRLFKMSPIHHHFEMCGWSEMKIVCVFSAFTALCGLTALLLVIFGLT
ncbi:phospho-N-acetylmuramoyl-pentapeptide-transferase [uncultured Ruminococcus sp.]|uniref:phospho-N-acetylmuramoyl-pentapeptide- transferase n=1 Tax=uncultured Ruminococcus sp. TaxID=165186 RepID=UPI00292FE351|nr:phospho-N-acetylmuramoyl-pentapeptide-transferase [uncultured Ruminococcus sp.]